MKKRIELDHMGEGLDLLWDSDTEQVKEENYGTIYARNIEDLEGLYDYLEGKYYFADYEIIDI